MYIIFIHAYFVFRNKQLQNKTRVSHSLIVCNWSTLIVCNYRKFVELPCDVFKCDIFIIRPVKVTFVSRDSMSEVDFDLSVELLNNYTSL